MTLELLSLQVPDMAHEDDTTLDGWLASLTTDQFERILDALARTHAERRAAAS